MAKIILCLTKDDIRTTVIHKNISIETGIFSINFDTEAVDELIADLMHGKGRIQTNINYENCDAIDPYAEMNETGYGTISIDSNLPMTVSDIHGRIITLPSNIAEPKNNVKLFMDIVRKWLSASTVRCFVTSEASHKIMVQDQRYTKIQGVGYMLDDKYNIEIDYDMVHDDFRIFEV